MPSGGLCSDWLRLRTVVNRVSLPTSVWTRQGRVPAAPSLCCAASSPRLAKGARPALLLGKATGDRAPSISIGAGQSALERMLEMVSSACVATGTAPTGVRADVNTSRSVVMGHDGGRE